MFIDFSKGDVGGYVYPFALFDGDGINQDIPAASVNTETGECQVYATLPEGGHDVNHITGEIKRRSVFLKPPLRIIDGSGREVVPPLGEAPF